MTRADLVLLSGGLDSTTALAVSASNGYATRCVSVDYGQRHRRELLAAAAIAEHYDLPHHVIDLSSWGNTLKGSALTDPTTDVPDGEYSPSTLATTVVPNRNATFLMAAAGIAAATGCTHVITATHAGDHQLYPDCRPEFIDAARTTVEAATEDTVTLDAPFLHRSKTAIVVKAHDYNAPIGMTWSCYKGASHHCGTCSTCIERRNAFQSAGVADPTTYTASPEAAE